jgi:acetyltransferase-like isoleucine patch superfamily enzyme
MSDIQPERRCDKSAYNMLYKKAMKLLAKSFPLNWVRVVALRAAGYHVGELVYIGEDFLVVDDLDKDACSLFIGNRVAISARVLIVLASYPNHSVLRERVGDVFGSVTIEDDVWIGAGVTILPNVTIGKQAIVGAGAVVTRDVAPHSIVVGNPARILEQESART